MSKTEEIVEVTIVNQQGSKTFKRGGVIGGLTIETIKKIDIYFQGDPFQHYAGFSFDGQMLFSVAAMISPEAKHKNYE